MAVRWAHDSQDASLIYTTRHQLLLIQVEKVLMSSPLSIYLKVKVLFFLEMLSTTT